MMPIFRNTSSEVKRGTENLSTFVKKGKVGEEKRIINRPPERKCLKTSDVKTCILEVGNFLCTERHDKKSCAALMTKLKLQIMNEHCYKLFTVTLKKVE